MKRYLAPAVVCGVLALGTLTACGSSSSSDSSTTASSAASATASVTSTETSSTDASASATDEASASDSVSESTSSASESASDDTSDSASPSDSASASDSAPSTSSAAAAGPVSKTPIAGAKAQKLPAAVGEWTKDTASTGPATLYKNDGKLNSVEYRPGMGFGGSVPYIVKDKTAVGSGFCGQTTGKANVCYLEADPGVVVITPDDAEVDHGVAFATALVKALG